jgi:hypothetical protein
MDLDNLQNELDAIYAAYERSVVLYTSGAICRPGCAFCCTHFGTVDMTTLEGMVIQRWIASRPRADGKTLLRKIDRNRKSKEKGASAPCPFLKPDRTCLIYALRPFSCRQLYSVRPCDGRGPTIHRQAHDAARHTIAELQRLDHTGYSGHISYILYLLEQKNFRQVYLNGGFDPAAIAAFGQKHGIVINRVVSPRSNSMNLSHTSVT